MGQSLHIDMELVRALMAGLSMAADRARRDLSDLKDALAREGEPWGDDEPGRLIGESYTPQAEKALEGYENLVDNLRELSKGVADVADDFGRQDRLGGDLVQGLESDRFGPRAPFSGELYSTSRDVDVPAASYPSGAGPVIEGSAGTPQPTAAGPWTPSPGNPSAGPASRFTGDGSVGKPSAVGRQPGGPQPTSADPSALRGSRDTGGSSTASSGPVYQPIAPQSIASPVAPRTIVSPPATPGTTASPNSRQPRTAGSSPANLPPTARTFTAVGRSADTPWSRASGGPVTPPNSAGAPSSRPGPAGVRPGRVVGPELVGPAAVPGKPVRKGPDDKSRKKAAGPERDRPPISTDPRALETAREMAERHGIQLAGFETSGIGVHTVSEIAAALDDILGRYPFIEVGGIEVGEFGRRRVSRVGWNRDGDESEQAHGERPWLLLDRTLVANPARLAAQARAATRAGCTVRGSAERPMYSAVVGDLGHMLEALAGPYPRRSAQRALIAEYHRISGPWAGRDTLTQVVDGYRDWRNQLGDGNSVEGGFEPRAALEAAFVEVELHGTAACGPAKVLHLLMVESARGRWDSR